MHAAHDKFTYDTLQLINSRWAILCLNILRVCAMIFLGKLQLLWDNASPRLLCTRWHVVIWALKITQI